MHWSALLIFSAALVGLTVFGGVILAELTLSDIPMHISPYSAVLSLPLVIVGLLFMSVPPDYTDRAFWSDVIARWGRAHFPLNAQHELHRTFGSVGALLLILGIILSPDARRLLSAKPLAWLGRISFPIYLLHGTFLRSVLAWLMFTSEARIVETDNGPVARYPLGGNFRILFSVVVSMSLMLAASHYWANKIEPIFGKITARAEAIMFGKNSCVGKKPVLPIGKG